MRERSAAGCEKRRETFAMPMLERGTDALADPDLRDLRHLRM
jgi:hypothetical protein